jgi:hypothetical protein
VKARRRPVADRIERDGESVVLIGREVIRLSALATVLLDSCADWTDDADLADRLLARLGPAPDGVDAEAATVSALNALHEQGLVDLD